VEMEVGAVKDVVGRVEYRTGTIASSLLAWSRRK
jgi:hypothetical protein